MKIGFHASRSTYSTLVDETGASEKTTLELTRHNTKRVAYGRYVKARAERLRDTVEAVGAMIANQDEACATACGGRGVAVTSDCRPSYFHEKELAGATGHH